MRLFVLILSIIVITVLLILHKLLDERIRKDETSLIARHQEQDVQFIRHCKEEDNDIVPPKDYIKVHQNKWPVFVNSRMIVRCGRADDMGRTFIRYGGPASAVMYVDETIEELFTLITEAQNRE